MRRRNKTHALAVTASLSNSDAALRKVIRTRRASRDHEQAPTSERAVATREDASEESSNILLSPKWFQSEMFLTRGLTAPLVQSLGLAESSPRLWHA